MDEVYLINELRASFLKHSNEISKTRVIDPYQNHTNDSTIHKLYIDNKSGKDYYKIMKSPSINDDYFNTIANEENGSYSSPVKNYIAEDRPRQLEESNKFDHNRVNSKKTIEDQSSSRRNSMLSFSTHNDLHSNSSKVPSKGSKSRLRLSRLSGLFHRQHSTDNNKLYYTSSNPQYHELFKTRSKSASLFSKENEVSSNNSITHSGSRTSSDVLRMGVNSLYRKMSNNSSQSFHSKESPKLNHEDKNHSKTTSFLSKGRKLFHIKHNSSNKKHGSSSNKGSKSDSGKDYSTKILEDMMYTDQLFREGEIPDNFDDSEEEDDDYDIKGSTKSSVSAQKNSLYQRNFSKSFGKKHEDEETSSMTNTNDSEKRKTSNNDSISQTGSTNKTEQTPNSVQKESTYDINEDFMFNFKKIGKKILPSTNNNITAENSNDGNVVDEMNVSDKSLSNIDNFGTQPTNLMMGYDRESIEIESFLEDGQNLDKVLNFDEFNNSHSLKSSLSSVINEPMDAKHNTAKEPERYYGDLASSFGESLMDDEYDDAIESVENSVPSKHQGFLLSKNDKNDFESDIFLNENYNEYTGFIAEDGLIDYFAKDTKFNKSDEKKLSNLSNYLKPNTLTNSEIQMNEPTIDYEDIIDDRNGIELTCYLEGNEMPIDLNISMSKKVTNLQLLQLILYKFDLQDDVDSYMLRIVDDDGLPFEGTFGILKRDGLVERSLMMEELVACKIDDAKQVDANKAHRLQHGSKSSDEEKKTSNNTVDNDKRVLVIDANENSFIRGVSVMNIETKDLDTVGEVVSRFCLYNDVDPKKYYLRVRRDSKHYLPGDMTLKYFFNNIYKSDDKYEIISIKESRQINLRKFKYDEEDEKEDDDVYEGNEHVNGLTPFTLANGGDYLPVSAPNLKTRKNLDSTTKKSNDKHVKKHRQNQKKFLKALQKQHDNLHSNGVPLNLSEIYYRYTVFRRQHQKVTLLTNKQLKTLMIDGDFIYLVDCDLSIAPMATENEFKAENSVYGFGGNNSVWEPEHFLRSKASNGDNDNITTTKTFHVSQIIQIEKSLKNRTHFKIKFIRSHGPKWYYFETLSSSDRDEIITKLSLLKAIYNRNK